MIVPIAMATSPTSPAAPRLVLGKVVLLHPLGDEGGLLSDYLVDDLG